MNNLEVYLPDAQATQAYGQHLAQALTQWGQGLVISLQGELGAGKTALARATIQALGYSAAVVSPTYTLLETYTLPAGRIHHLDLYRLADPEELEYIGLRELANAQDWFLVEWAVRGQGYLPAVDINLQLSYAQIGRALAVQPLTAAGQRFCAQLL